MSSVAIVGAQGRGRGAAPPPTGRAGAPKDLTGYWVSVVTEHWHLRMLVPPKGDYSMLPLNGEARTIADSYDAARLTADDQCKAYGAAAIMRVPGRLNIHWVDDNTLQIDTDAGAQTRLLRFRPSEADGQAAADWQGYSVAAWEGSQRGRGGAGSGGQLRVTTTRMKPGFLRRNGVPYGERAVLQEYFDRFEEPNGDVWLLVTTIVTDSQYLTQPYATTVQFKKIPDRQGWDPTPCRAMEAR